MTAEEKEPYHIQALHEQQKRTELASTPLPKAGEGLTDLELEVGRSGSKKLSAKRLLLNEEQLQGSTTWSWPTQLGDGGLSATSYIHDMIDMTDSD